VNLTNDDVQEILRLLEASSFDELHLQTERFKLTLRRAGASGVWSAERHTLNSAQLVNASSAGADAAAPRPAETPQPAAAPAADIVEVRPPIIGTFYRAPKPGADPFVDVGARVLEDTVVGIVETMKLMNSVYAGARGEVIEICAENGGLVETHDVLMRLRRTPQ
jgi:acetyl-CoA carboxylase biotin carboxyl carrier protein